PVVNHSSAHNLYLPSGAPQISQLLAVQGSALFFLSSLLSLRHRLNQQWLLLFQQVESLGLIEFDLQKEIMLRLSYGTVCSTLESPRSLQYLRLNPFSFPQHSGIYSFQQTHLARNGFFSFFHLLSTQFVPEGIHL